MELYTESQGQPLNLSFGEETLSLGDGDSNAMILPNKKNNKRKSMKQECEKLKAKPVPRLSKSQKKKIKKLEEEKGKSLLLSKSIETLKRYNIPDDAYSLLQSSRHIGQVESMRVKRRKSIEYSKAGFEAPGYGHQYKQSGNDIDLSESEPELDKVQARYHHYKNNPIQPISVQREVTGSASVSLDCFQGPVRGDESGVDILATNYSFNSKVCNNDYIIGSREENDCVPKNGTNSIKSMESDCHGQRSITAPTVVHVSRPDEVENKRKDIPIVMMEQEIMEAINENSTVIICGETGCGKTTQVPQFLYEAGFGSKQSLARGGIIGITQPRRVAVLATAKRVAYELGLSLGKEVGFQVRYDKKIGNSSSIKFMTDGILLRELQNDFLLRRYSIIILDEAHERSLNTDILIGMLSRVIQGREKVYAQQQKLLLSGGDISLENMIFPLKLVLMSATLRVEDFISGQRLFREPPPVLEVHTRQFPVTIHFSKRTEIIDYVGQAYKKVLAIHKRLPPGGILVFVTGQREVEYLCKKLHRASKEFIIKTSRGNLATDGSSTSEPNSVSGINMKDINEAYDIDGSSAHQQTDRFSTNDNDDDDDHFDTDNDDSDFSYDSGSESELEMLGDSGDPEHHKTPGTDSKHVDALGDNASVASLKAAFEALAGQSASNSNSDQKESSFTPEGHLDQSDDPSTGIKSENGSDVFAGALHVLPLYALLPAAAQLRVFEEVKEGERLVVVATNVAETSLTIPGIKYVVDTGREKVKNYNTSNGMETYEVQWISKASAAQRAGRAGRTGPGHCYRLYSSAVYNNIFPNFSLAEILKVPVDGVVLLMKSMHIDKVTNFPFPTPPDAVTLREAEHCLKALEALDSTGKLTVLGKAMARFPMSPRHSRMLLTVVQIMRKKKSDARPNLVLAYAAASAAALSLPNPFVVQYENSCSKKDDLEHDENSRVQENKKVVDKQEKLRRKKIKETLKVSREKFCNPGSDALSIAYALQCFELSNSPAEFCNEHALHLKTMEEMSKLRKQLLQLVFNHSSDFGIDQEFSWIYGTLEDIEQVWRLSYNKHPLSLYEEELLGQAICAGWADRVAKRVRGSSGLSEGVIKVHAVRYQACMVKETVFLHRLSSVSNSAPEFLVYSELLQTKRPYMHGVTRVKPEWLVEYARPLCTFSTPSVDMKPYYDPQMDRVLHYVIPSFGPYLWELSPCSMPIGDSVLRITVFAYALLEGQVLPCLKYVRKFMAAPPSSILRPEASGQKRVGNLLSKLKKKSIDSCAMLRDVWMENPKELYSEIMDWFQENFRKNFETLWTEMLHEILLEGHERFPKKLKRVKSKK